MPTCQRFQSFGPKDPDEINVISFDVAELLGSEVIDSCLFDSELYGAGTVDASMILGLPSVSGTIVSTRVQGGHDGSVYLIRLTITTASALILICSALLPVSRGGAA